MEAPGSERGRNRETLTLDFVEMVIRWPCPAVADRARDTGAYPVPELTSSCVGSPKNLRASVDDTDERSRTTPIDCPARHGDHFRRKVHLIVITHVGARVKIELI